jgi:hypothetical protein
MLGRLTRDVAGTAACEETAAESVVPGESAGRADGGASSAGVGAGDD